MPGREGEPGAGTGRTATFYNLRWDGHIYSASAYYKTSKDEDGYITTFDLNLGMPAPLWHKEDEVRGLWREALQVQYSGMSRRAQRVRVNFVGHPG